MADFMGDHIVTYFWRQKNDFIIEIQIPFCRTTTPTTLLISNSYFLYRNTVVGTEIFDSFCNHSSRNLLVGRILQMTSRTENGREYSDSWEVHRL